MSGLYLTHISCVFLSISGFFARGILHFRQSELVQARWLRITPHVVDTVLLVSGVMLALNYADAKGELTWLWPKLALLLCYIVFGLVSFRFAKTRSSQFLFWLAALLSAAGMIGLAHFKWTLLT